MRPLYVVMFVVVMLLVVAIGCGKRAAEQLPAQQERFQMFYVSVTGADGVSPNKLVVIHGADLVITAFDTAVTMRNKELGIDTVVPARGNATLRVGPVPAGEYAIACVGCPPQNDKLILSVK